MKNVIPNHTEIDYFQSHGAICLRGLLSTDLIQTLCKGIELNLEQPSERHKIVSQKTDAGLFIEDFCTWQCNPYYYRFIFDSPLGKVAAALMQSKEVRLHHDHVLVKNARTQQPTPWHQDQPYYNLDGRKNISFWIPVDPIPRSATLEFISGSHLGEWFMPRSFMDYQSRWFPPGTLREIPDIESARDNYPILGWEVQPGDVIAFHMLTLHAARGSTPNQRRVFSVRFIGDDITHAPRPWTTSPDFPGLAAELPAGAPFNHPLFPRVFIQN